MLLDVCNSLIKSRKIGKVIRYAPKCVENCVKNRIPKNLKMTDEYKFQKCQLSVYFNME